MAESTKPKSQKVSLSTDALEAKITEIKVIDEKIGKLRGTAAEWLNKGKEAARGFGFVSESVITVSALTLGSMLDQLHSVVEEVEQFGNEIVSTWIKANRTGGNELSALKDQRDKLVSEAEAMRGIFVQMLGEESMADYIVPKATRSNGNGVTRTVKAGQVRYYWVKDGEKVEPSDSQQSLSSMAFYKFGKCGAEALQAGLKFAGWDGTLTTDAEYTVTVGDITRTIGWYVVKADETSEVKGN